MGKHGKKQRNPSSRSRRFARSDEGEDDDSLPSSAYNPPSQGEGTEEDEEGAEIEDDGEDDENASAPSRFDLYQRSVQSPKGDISYLQKFFLMYIGGRLPLHLQEDFCGTAFLSSEWLRSDSRRTAVGLDLDLEALKWCLANNLNKIGADGYSRIFLYHGNVLQPGKASLVKSNVQDLMRLETLSVQNDSSETVNSKILSNSTNDLNSTLEDAALPARDIICAFNYSCCCLQIREDLVSYFKHARCSLSKRGGIFVMDLYGGTSSEGKLRLQRRFANFTYVWEQAAFDIINRRTRISLHFQLGKKQTLKHAFSYDWRLWSLPEIRDCLIEAGFQSVHFWMREMPNTQEMRNSAEYHGSHDAKYEEKSSFEQLDAWNAYIVAVANL